MDLNNVIKQAEVKQCVKAVVQLPDEIWIKAHHTSSSALSIPEVPVVSHSWFTSGSYSPQLHPQLTFDCHWVGEHLHFFCWFLLLLAPPCCNEECDETFISTFFQAIHVFWVIYTSLCRKAQRSQWWIMSCDAVKWKSNVLFFPTKIFFIGTLCFNYSCADQQDIVEMHLCTSHYFLLKGLQQIIQIKT